MKSRSIIYYTDNSLREKLFSTVQHELLKAGLPIISVSQKPIDFGRNIVFKGKPSYISMTRQIFTALKHSKTKYVFYCEHDVLYPKSHFDFTPLKDNIFYYNNHIWRWGVGEKHAINYDRMLCLSCMCVNRKYALNYYKRLLKRIKNVRRKNWKMLRGRSPRIARIWGFEPGTKKKRRGGFSNDDYDTWHSKEPVVDIRHPGTVTINKVHLKDFRCKPTNWKSIPYENVPYWGAKLTKIKMKKDRTYTTYLKKRGGEK